MISPIEIAALVLFFMVIGGCVALIYTALYRGTNERAEREEDARLDRHPLWPPEDY